MSAAISSVDSSSDSTTTSGGGSPSSNTVLRSKCERSNLGLDQTVSRALELLNGVIPGIKRWDGSSVAPDE
jgi:hypothetical protein